MSWWPERAWAKALADAIHPASHVQPQHTASHHHTSCSHASGGGGEAGGILLRGAGRL